MTNEILHVRARCGAGKSIETIKEMMNHLLTQKSVSDTYLFASKTNDLTRQNYQTLQQFIQGHPNGTDLTVERIDSTQNKGTVVRDLSDLLSAGFKGVIFISHRALASISPSQLKGARIVIDEVPQELVGFLILHHRAQDHGQPWERFLEQTESPYSKAKRVKLRSDIDRDDVRNYIQAIMTGKDNTTTAKVADMLDFLLRDYEALYTSSQTSGGTTLRHYHAVHYHRLKELMSNVSFLAILSSQLKDTFLGHIAEQRLGYPIVEKDISDQVTLVKKHRNHVRIIPFLKDGSWSTTLRNKQAKEALCFNGKPVPDTGTVGDFAQTFAARIMGQRDFLITLNQNEKLITSLSHVEKNRTSTQVHGMNHLSHLDHAVYLASSNPTPIETISARLFAMDNGLDVKKLLDSIVIDRCYETAYQCIARTSIRNDQVKADMEHLIIVPDSKYAEYVKQWFEKGYCTIDPSHSYTTPTKEGRKTRQELYKTMIIQILKEKLSGKGTLNDLIANSGISKSTYNRYKEIFRNELESVGLLKPQNTHT